MPPTGMGEKKAKNAAAVELGRKGGLVGGPARAAKLTPAKRRAISLLGVAARRKKAGSVGNSGVK